LPHWGNLSQSSCVITDSNPAKHGPLGYSSMLPSYSRELLQFRLRRMILLISETISNRCVDPLKTSP